MTKQETNKKMMENNMKMVVYRRIWHSMSTNSYCDKNNLKVKRLFKMKDLIHQVNGIMWRDYDKYKEILSDCVYKNFYNFITKQQNIIDKDSEFEAIDSLIEEKIDNILHIQYNTYQYQYYTDKEKQDSKQRNTKIVYILKDLKTFLDRKYVAIKTREEDGVKFSETLTIPTTYNKAEEVRRSRNSRPRHNHTNKYFVKEIK